MADCEFCMIVRGDFESEEIYSDDDVFAVMHLKPAAPGHILLFTKQHYSIVEQIPDKIVGHLLSVANKLSIAIFESVGAQGTNIIVENGVASGQTVPHVSVHIIPRRENDGLNLQWTPKKLNNDEMDVVQYQLKEQAQNIASIELETVKKKTAPEEKKDEKKKMGSPNDHRIRQLRRIP